MKSPIFSIVIPCYNSWRYMERGLHFLEKQTFIDFEVIFVDDCSTDDTYCQLEKYQQQSILSIRIIRNIKNSGPGESRNYGIKMAKGDYIAFLDSDDWYEVDFLEKMYGQLQKTGADIVFCDFYRDFGNGNKKCIKSTAVYHKLEEKKAFIALCFDSLCTSVVKRTLFDRVSIPAIYNAEDTAMMPILVYKSSKVSYISQPLYHYLYRPGSLSTAKSDQIANSFYQAFSFLANSIPNEYKDEICFRGIKMLLYGVFYHIIRLGGDPKEAEKNWEKIKTAVVSELAGNYEFVREPEAVPEGKDFVEWFLKESKKGNSVHFAAAATMLLRACGMPARYVVGYAAPASLFQGQEDGSYQAVLEDDNAHAWAEVYREGIGWTVVEATPGFAALVTESDGASGQKEKEADSPDTPGEAFYQEDTPEAETPGIGSRIFRVVKKALATVALLITVCGILAVIRRHILCKRRKRGRKGEAPGEQIQRIYRSFAALQKFNKKSVCSCQEERFAKQLGKKYPVFSEKTAQKLANIVLKACYSDQGLTKKECQFVLDCYEKLAEAVSKELSPAKRLVGSLIFCFW